MPAPPVQLYTTCWDENASVRVRIVDTCPCTQVGYAGVLAVKPYSHTARLTCTRMEYASF